MARLGNTSIPISPPTPLIQHVFQVKNVKLEFPRFDGTVVLDWFFKAEQFFDYYGTPDEDCNTITSIHMDKDVVPWFQMLQ